MARIADELADWRVPGSSFEHHAQVASPNPNWGAITNTSIEGGQVNPHTGISGDWSGTVFDAIYQACGQSVDQAGMFFGNVWKMVLIGRDEQWVGIRVDPTFPQRGITLQGKSYFLDTSV